MSVLEAGRDHTCELEGNYFKRKSMPGLKWVYEVMSRSFFYLSPQNFPKRFPAHSSYLAFFLLYLSFEEEPWEREKYLFRERDANMKITMVKPTLIELYVSGTLVSPLYVLVHFVFPITLEGGYSQFTGGETEAPLYVELSWLKGGACLKVQVAWV